MKTRKQIVVLFLSLALSTLSTVAAAGNPDPRRGPVADQSEPAISNHHELQDATGPRLVNPTVPRCSDAECSYDSGQV